jgi:pilus assembly protein CpaB
LVGAIVVGAIAALLILKYVNGVEDRAANDTQMVPVVIATGDIAKGESAEAAIAANKIEIGNRRRIDLPANAVSRLEDIVGQTATIDLAAGEVVTIPKFSSGGDLSSSRSNALQPGNVAVTVSFDSTRGVAGLVQPGDYVNILVDTSATTALDESGTPVANAGPAPVGASYLYQKVKILALGTNLGTQVAASSDPTATTVPPAASDLVTFEVPPEAAVVLAAASQKSLRLSLVRPDYQPHPIPAILVDPNVGLPGEQGHTPYDGQPSTAAPVVGATK